MAWRRDDQGVYSQAAQPPPPSGKPDIEPASPNDRVRPKSDVSLHSDAALFGHPRIAQTLYILGKIAGSAKDEQPFVKIGNAPVGKPLAQSGHHRPSLLQPPGHRIAGGEDRLRGR